MNETKCMVLGCLRTDTELVCKVPIGGCDGPLELWDVLLCAAHAKEARVLLDAELNVGMSTRSGDSAQAPCSAFAQAFPCDEEGAIECSDCRHTRHCDMEDRREDIRNAFLTGQRSMQ